MNHFIFKQRLSDPKLEEALLVRMDFLLFCGLSLSDPAPDETTLYRFRHRPIDAGRLDKMTQLGMPIL